MTAPGIECRSVADHGILAHVSERIDRHVRADPGRRGDARLRMDAGPARLLLADQMGADGEKRGHRVVDFDDSQTRRSTSGSTDG